MVGGCGEREREREQSERDVFRGQPYKPGCGMSGRGNLQRESEKREERGQRGLYYMRHQTHTHLHRLRVVVVVVIQARKEGYLAIIRPKYEEMKMACDKLTPHNEYIKLRSGSQQPQQTSSSSSTSSPSSSSSSS